MRALAVHHEAALPAREISALAVRGRPGGRSQLLAVGDEDLAVITAELDDGRPADAERHDLSLPLRDSPVDVRSGSDFEGVAADGEGTVFLLQEEESRLLVLAADL